MDTNRLYITGVDIRQREEGEDFALVSYGSLKGSANRICNSPEVALAEQRAGLPIAGSIQRAEVIPYKADFEDGKGEQTVAVRNVVVFQGETLDEATKAAGHTLKASPAPAKEKALATAGADITQRVPKGKF